MGDVIKERKYKVIVIQISYLQYGEYMDLNHLKENLINRGTPAEEVKIILEYVCFARLSYTILQRKSTHLCA